MLLLVIWRATELDDISYELERVFSIRSKLNETQRIAIVYVFTKIGINPISSFF